MADDDDDAVVDDDDVVPLSAGAFRPAIPLKSLVATVSRESVELPIIVLDDKTSRSLREMLFPFALRDRLDVNAVGGILEGLLGSKLTLGPALRSTTYSLAHLHPNTHYQNSENHNWDKELPYRLRDPKHS